METHAALRNTDILEEIFSHLLFFPDPAWSLEPTPSENAAALLNAALCCKTFCSPALDALWWRLDDLAHLLRVLPAFTRAGTTYVIDGPVTERQWGLFNAYAKRVRHLGFIDDVTHPSVYLRLSQIAKLSPLLPNVQSIQAMPRCSGLLCLLSPSLLELSMHPDDTVELFPTVWTCLEALPEAAPKLKVLHVQTTLSAASLISFSRMSNLRDLSLVCRGIYNVSFFHSLSTLEYLNSLRIDFDVSTVTSKSQKAVSSTSAFPSLNDLLIFISPHEISALLSVFKQHPLEELTIYSADELTIPPTLSPPEPNMWMQGLQDISSKFHSLRHLSLGYQGNPYTVTAEPAFYLFEPLLQLSTLNTICLSFSWLLFSDDEYKRIAAAWPALQELSFAGSVGTPNATLLALQAFASRCTKLCTLSIPFDARRLPPTAAEDTPISSNELKVLNTQNSPIESPLAVAEHLHRIFPKVKSIQPGSYGELWEQVGGHIKTLSMARKQQARNLESREKFPSSDSSPILENGEHPTGE